MLRQQLSLLKTLYINRARRVPSKLNLNITSLCNSQCRTCNVWMAYREDPDRAKNELAEDEIKRLLGRPNLPFYWLAITGGEPFLRQDLERILLFVINECPSIKMLTMPSNGLDKKRILSCMEKVKNQKRVAFYISFSLDGPPEVHDAVRGIKGGYAKTWDTYSEARRVLGGNRFFHVGLETTISKYNIADVNSFICRLIAEGHSVVVNVAHSAQFYRNKEDEASLPPFDSGEARAIVDDINSNVRGFSPEKMLRRVYLKNCAHYIEDASRRVLLCRALQTSLAIDPYGNVYPCLMWNNALGNIRDHAYDVMALWHAAGRLSMRKEIVQGHCPNCWTPCEAYPAILENFYRMPVLKNIW